MPEKEIAKSAWDIGPWIIGAIATILGLFATAIRNEYTTKKINTTLYDKNNDLRLMKKDDCQKCQESCQASFKENIKSVSNDRDRDRQEMRDDLQLIHQKIDDLPEKMVKIIGNLK